MKQLLFVFMLMIALNVNAQEGTHRYEIKSGILQEFTDMDGHITPDVRYFDNYGDDEVQVQTIDMGALGSFQNTTVTKKEKAWMYNEANKPTSFDNPTADLTFVNPSQAVIDKYKLVDTGEEEEYLGRKCRKFTYEITQGRKKKIINHTAWVYKGVILRSVMQNGRQITIFEVTDFQENAEVPAEVFVIPEK